MIAILNDSRIRDVQADEVRGRGRWYDERGDEAKRAAREEGLAPTPWRSAPICFSVSGEAGFVGGACRSANDLRRDGTLEGGGTTLQEGGGTLPTFNRLERLVGDVSWCFSHRWVGDCPSTEHGEWITLQGWVQGTSQGAAGAISQKREMVGEQKEGSAGRRRSARSRGSLAQLVQAHDPAWVACSQPSLAKSR